MSSKKRGSDAGALSATKSKRVKTSSTAKEKSQPTAGAPPEEVDFPRGGGTSFTPVEYTAIRAEALKELNDGDVFKDSVAQNTASKRGQKWKSDVGKPSKKSAMQQKPIATTTRVEHLNYKRIVPGMKFLCQVVAVYPFSLIVSLPDQLFGHIPTTHISSQLTHALDTVRLEDLPDEEMDTQEDSATVEKDPPDLTELFQCGQYLRAVVSAVKPPGTTEGAVFSYSRDGTEKASRRVELSLIPNQVNAGLAKADLKKGFTLCAAVQSAEDHGYILDLGLRDVSGFLRYEQSADVQDRRRVGSLVDVVVDKLSEDGRTCIFNVEQQDLKATLLKEISNVSSVLPGALVQGLVTSVFQSGLVVQLLGSLEGTVDLYHLPSTLSPSDFKEGKKIKARVLYDVAGASPPRYALTLKEHIIALDTKRWGVEGKQPIQEGFPIGTILQSVKVKRVEAEKGSIVEVEEGVEGFVHISHTSDDHIASLSSSSGPWKVGSVHQARVVGFHSLDGILQLTFRSSILAQKFLRVDDVTIGEVVKGTVKKLTETSLFVSINGNVDAVIWPNHYADIMLKHPQRRFKPGASLKSRVLVVDPGRKRIMLTAKKTLVDSDLPIISRIQDAEAGMVAHGAVWKVLEKSLVVEFYSNVRAIVPMREVSESAVANLAESFPVGKPVKVCILSVEREAGRLVASIRQASGDSVSLVGNIKDVEIGQTVSGIVQEVHGDNVLLTLEPSRARALISLNNIANRRRMTVEQLRSSIKSGEMMEELVILSRNLDKGIVIVANHPSGKAQTLKKTMLDINTISIGSTVVGRVLTHNKQGAIVRFSGNLTGSLHAMDTCDDLEQSNALPPVPSTLTAAVIAIDREAKRLALSTRPSRLDPKANVRVVDPEIGSVQDLKVGQKLRGFIKNVADHGVFVTIGRGVDARVQIREVHDEYVKDWKSGFHVNQLVTGKILSINHEEKQVEMTFRSAEAAFTNTEMSFSDIVISQKVDGRVKKIEDYGVFITIEGAKLSGLCHKSEIADNKDSDIGLALRNFREGDSVKAVILAVDSEKRRISFGLKPSYFSKEDLDPSSEGANAMSAHEDDVEMTPITAESSEADADEAEVEESVDDDDGDNVMIVDSSSAAAPLVSIPIFSKEGPRSLAPAIASLGFQWTNDEQYRDAEIEASSSEDDSDGPSERKRKKKKKVIEQDFTADMQTRTPECVADFERHLLASPNSSFLWIQYMSFQLQLAEIDKARETGKRALQAINIREEQEKLNVWIALLNLENTYGTEESLEALFKDAARHNDSKTVHLRFAHIFDQSGMPEKAEEQYKRTSKKFGRSSKVWTLFGEHYLRRGLIEESRSLLPRSLQSLEKRKHLKTISKFAQLEYKLGDPERGKTIFEGIVDSHPKRWDLWSIYMDMEASQNNIQSLRNLFDRVFSRKMTSHKAKSFFKKWLELERRVGDEEGQQIVKAKAIEWTQRASSST